jgi:hypothetical protein
MCKYPALIMAGGKPREAGHRNITPQAGTAVSSCHLAPGSEALRTLRCWVRGGELTGNAHKPTKWERDRKKV